MANDALKIVAHEIAEPMKRPTVRVGESSPADELDPAVLIDMLGDIDGLKSEIQDRVKRTEAVKQAKSLLMEDAQRTEALNRRLAEIGKLMSAVHSGILVENEYEDADVPRMRSRDAHIEAEARHSQVRVLNEGATYPWPKSDEESTDEERSARAEVVQLSSPGHDHSQALTDYAAHHSVSLPVGYDLERLEKVEHSVQQVEEVAAEARRLFEESVTRLDAAVVKEEEAAAEFACAKEALIGSHDYAREQLEAAERSLRQTEQATQEARQLLEKSAADLIQSRQREESIAAGLQSVREEFTTAYQSASQRLEEAERFWQRGDQAAQEAQNLIDQTTAELLQARSKEETARADLQSARQELTTAYQFAAVAAQRRLDAVEFFKKTARWVIFATTLSWIAMIWTVWISIHKAIPIAAPGVATVLVVVFAVIIGKRGMNAAEES
jgi:DNA repair exonuclease SbcCD ATPase subunit